MMLRGKFMFTALTAVFAVLYVFFVLFWANTMITAGVIHEAPVPVTHTSRSSHGASVALLEAAKHPVVIGIVDGSGQWPFWQAMQPGRDDLVSATSMAHFKRCMPGYTSLSQQQPVWYEKDCSYQGVSINCQFTINASQFSSADGLYYHIPSKRPPYKILPRQHPKQIRFAVSLESASYYAWQNDPAYMCNFEAEATYRSCSQVQQSLYFETQHDFNTGKNLLGDWQELPYEQKEHAVAYINSNCGALSNRAQLLRQWMNLHGAKMQVHSFGRCDNNRPWPTNGTHRLAKLEVFHRYSFCIAMENSLSYDYITEKVWDALAAGCVPIYMGSPNIFSIVPDPQSIIVYGPGGNATTIEELDKLVFELGADKLKYNRMLAWKHKPLAELSFGYQRHCKTLHSNTNECRLCIHVVKKRAINSFARDITCLWNQTWLKEAGMPFVNLTCPSS